jgi:hypothetical protein
MQTPDRPPGGDAAPERPHEERVEQRLVEERRNALKILVTLCAAIFLLGFAADGTSGAEGADDKAVRDSFNTAADLYIKTTQDDLRSDIHFPNARVTLLSSDIARTRSLVTPYAGKIEYVVEYDDVTKKGARKYHPYIMQCIYFDGKWDIDPHGHARRRNLKDLQPSNAKVMISPDV